MSTSVYYGTGRRKRATARVYLTPGAGRFMVNDLDLDAFFRRETDKMILKQPLVLTETDGSFDILVNVRGGGTTGQAGAIKQGAARALCELSADNRKPLKTEGHLSRDPRAKERRKYGLKKARKAPQFSKR